MKYFLCFLLIIEVPQGAPSGEIGHLHSPCTLPALSLHSTRTRVDVGRDLEKRFSLGKTSIWPQSSNKDYVTPLNSSKLNLQSSRPRLIERSFAILSVLYPLPSPHTSKSCQSKLLFYWASARLPFHASALKRRSTNLVASVAGFAKHRCCSSCGLFS